MVLLMLVLTIGEMCFKNNIICYGNSLSKSGLYQLSLWVGRDIRHKGRTVLSVMVTDSSERFSRYMSRSVGISYGRQVCLEFQLPRTLCGEMPVWLFALQ